MRSGIRARHGNGQPPLAWKVVTLDLKKPLPDVPTSGAMRLHVTAFAGTAPLGRLVVPAPLDPFPGILLAQALGPWFADGLHRERLLGALLPEPPAGPTPPATVIVCTRDRPDMLVRCLASLGRLADQVLETVVVDNGTRPAETKAIVAAAGARYVREPLEGLARARNRGLAASQGEIILWTDDDVEVDPCWARRLLRCFDDPLVMAATGLVLPASLETSAQRQFESHAGFWRGASRRMLTGSLCRPTAAGSLGAGASMALRADFLRRMGGFPEELEAGMPTAGGGDTYALYRVLRAGFRVVYEPSAVAYHTHRRTTAELHATVRGYGTGVYSYLTRAALCDRDFGAALAAGRWSARLLKNLVRALLRRPDAPPRGMAVSEPAGALATIWAYPAARRWVRQRPEVLPPGGARLSHPWVKELGRAERPTDADGYGDLPRLSVVIPSRGRRTLLTRLLESLDRQCFPDDRLEVIVCLDGDVDGSAQAVGTTGWGRRPHTIVLPSADGQPCGAAVARNRGAAAAGGDVLLFVDDDVQPVHERFLLAHARAHACVAGAVVGPCPPASWEVEGVFGQRVRNWWADHARRLVTAESLGFTEVATGNLSVARSVFLDHGGFMPIPRREDWEFGYRLLRAGVPVRCEPVAVALHDADADWATALEDRASEGVGDVAFVSRYPEVFAYLPLGAWPILSPRRRRLVRLALEGRLPLRQVRPAAARILAALEAAGLHHRHDQALSLLAALAYWSGVGQAVGGQAAWLKLVAAAGQAAGPPVPLDLAGEQWRPPALGQAAEAQVAYRDAQLGRAPLQWGGVPWDRDTFVSRVVDHFLDQAVTAEARQGPGT